MGVESTYSISYVCMSFPHFWCFTLGAQHPPSKFVREKHLLLPHILSNGFLVLAYVGFFVTFYSFVAGFYFKLTQ